MGQGPVSAGTEKAPNVFIAWAGPRSRKVAKAVFDWLPTVIQTVTPFASWDIDKGANWSTTIGGALRGCVAGIICLTPENQADTWINFEAGAISNTVADVQRVCTLLLDMKPADVKQPLAQFQHTDATTFDDMDKMLRTIANATGSGLADARLRTLHEHMWDPFCKEIKAASETNVAAAPAPRKPDDMIQEILEIVRTLSRRVDGPTWDEETRKVLYALLRRESSSVFRRENGEAVMIEPKSPVSTKRATRFPKSELVGLARAPDGKTYNLDFYGENEGAAVVSGPKPAPGSDQIVEVPEIHREAARDAAEARVKLLAWVKWQGWTVER